MRDEELKPKIAAVHAENYGVFGARKVWLQLNRERLPRRRMARCTVERLMGELGCAARSGARTGGPRSATRRRSRRLTWWASVRAAAPDRLWVADFT